MTEIYKDIDNSYSYIIINDQKFIDFDYYQNLKNKIDLAKLSLEFYANTENWINNDEDSENSVINRRDLESIEYKLKKNYSIKINTGGKIARDCLKSLGD